MDLVASAFFSSLTPYPSFNLTSVAAHSIMHPFTSLLVLGSLAVQAVFSLPDPSRVKEREAEILKRSVDSFIATESPIALAVCAPSSFFLLYSFLYIEYCVFQILCEFCYSPQVGNTNSRSSRTCCVTLALQELVLLELAQGSSWLRQTRPTRTVSILPHLNRPL